MSLSKIVSIPGMSGLYKMVAQLRNGGYLVESFTDQKRMPVSATQRIIMLQDISVYTQDGELPLNDVLLKMKENDEICSANAQQTSPSKLRDVLKKVIPEYDAERVHDSDIRKMFTWYGLLKDHIEKEIKEEVKTEEAVVETPPDPVKKTKKKSEAVAETEEKEAKPKAKRSVKKEVK